MLGIVSTIAIYLFIYFALFASRQNENDSEAIEDDEGEKISTTFQFIRDCTWAVSRGSKNLT